MTPRALNLNVQVSFRMTPAGERTWREHVRKLGLNESDYVLPGEYVWPLWELMMVFGPHTYMGMPRPLVENNTVYLYSPERMKNSK